MHDSFTALGGMVPMWLMQFGEGVRRRRLRPVRHAAVRAADGIAGLMIGRTPEYLGKKIDVYDMKMTALAIWSRRRCVAGRALAIGTDAGRAGIPARRPRLQRSAVCPVLRRQQQRQRFAGLSVNTPFYNLLLAFAMFVGRFGVILPVLAIAGSLSASRRATAPATYGPLFIGLLIGTVLLVGRADASCRRWRTGPKPSICALVGKLTDVTEREPRDDSQTTRAV